MDPTSLRSSLRCTKCRCQPEDHVPAEAKGYDPNSKDQLDARKQYDARLLPPVERAARHKAAGDSAFATKNFRTAYEEYSHAIAATPENHLLFGNRCQAYLKVGRIEAAQADAERAVLLAPDWAKGYAAEHLHYALTTR